MGIACVLLFYLALGVVLALPLAALLSFDKFYGGPRLWLYVLLNQVFLAWAVFDLLFTHHYMHGPNTIMLLVFPGPLAFVIFYAFVVPGMTPELARLRWDLRAVLVAYNLFAFGALWVLGERLL